MPSQNFHTVLFVLEEALLQGEKGRSLWPMMSMGADLRFLPCQGRGLSAAGIGVDVLDNKEADGHGGHGDCSTCPERLWLQLRESLVVQHHQGLPIQLHGPADKNHWQSQCNTGTQTTANTTLCSLPLSVVHWGAP